MSVSISAVSSGNLISSSRVLVTGHLEKRGAVTYSQIQIVEYFYLQPETGQSEKGQICDRSVSTRRHTLTILEVAARHMEMLFWPFPDARIELWKLKKGMEYESVVPTRRNERWVRSLLACLLARVAFLLSPIIMELPGVGRFTFFSYSFNFSNNETLMAHLSFYVDFLKELYY